MTNKPGMINLVKWDQQFIYVLLEKTFWSPQLNPHE